MEVPAKDHPWLCNRCGFLLGIVSADRSTLRIKYKDLYLTVQGKDVKVSQICRRCAAVNVLDSTHDRLLKQEEPSQGSNTKTE